MRTLIEIDHRLHVEDLDDLCNLPKVIRVNEFDEKALEEFEEDMDEAHQTGQPIIPVVIDSYGGSAYGLLGMVASVESSKVPVATIVTSKAMSAGAILFSFGREGFRFMHPDACLMIHDLGGFSDGKVEDIKVTANMMDEMNQRMYSRVSVHLGHSPDFIPGLIKKHHHLDWFLTAKKAKKLNIANHLCIPTFDVKIGLDIKFNWQDSQ